MPKEKIWQGCSCKKVCYSFRFRFTVRSLCLRNISISKHFKTVLCMPVECIFIVNGRYSVLWLHIYSHWRGHLLSLNYRKKKVDNIVAKTLSAKDFFFFFFVQGYNTISIGIDNLCANTCDRIKLCHYYSLFFFFFFFNEREIGPFCPTNC